MAQSRLAASSPDDRLAELEQRREMFVSPLSPFDTSSLDKSAVGPLAEIFSVLSLHFEPPD